MLGDAGFVIPVGGGGDVGFGFDVGLGDGHSYSDSDSGVGAGLGDRHSHSDSVGFAGAGNRHSNSVGFGNRHSNSAGLAAGFGDGHSHSNSAGLAGAGLTPRNDALSPTVVWWGEGGYQSIGGDQDGVDWDGDVLSLNIGVDGNLRWGGRHRDDLYGGWLVAWNDAQVDYKARGAGDTVENRGQYDLKITSLHPYIGRDVLGGQLALWLTGGYGLGHLEVADAAGRRRADVTMWLAGAGGDGALLRSGDAELRLKAEAFLARAKVGRGAAADEDGVGIAAAAVDTHRVRLAVEANRMRALAAGVSLRPNAELGLRFDGGDGLTGGGVELGGGARYRDAGRRLVAGARLRGLVGKLGKLAGADDWGVSGHFELEGGLDGQGWSLSVAPAYGHAARARQRWEGGGVFANAAGVSGGGVFGDGDSSGGVFGGGIFGDGASGSGDSADSAARRLRLDIQAGYGLKAFTATGLLTPFSAMTITPDARQYRLGMRWTQTARFTLQLTSQRATTANAATQDSFKLKGELRF